eukprot:Phypoly_transcript_03660.p1 GENE.Phypoly_transcript_03660~~Phypoly_transcript_03660.p1  ORF type:complete len:575 (+),score=70.62 Phypoly_transcript_03660:405-2129(+)
MEGEEGPPTIVVEPAKDLLSEHSSSQMLDNTSVEVRVDGAGDEEKIVPPNPPTPTPVPLRDHSTPVGHRRTHSNTGRTPLNQHSGARLGTPGTPSRGSFSTPPTPHILNQRYIPPEEGSLMGNLLTKYPILMWFLCCLTPLIYLLLMFGAIPIGERKDDDDDKPGRVGDTDRFHRYWVFTCVVNPINMTVIAFLNCGIFLSCMGVLRPFRVHWSILISVFVIETAVFTLIVPFTGTFDFFGVASLFLCYGSYLMAIYCYETWKVEKMWKEVPIELAQELAILHKNFWQFVKVAVSFLVFFLILLLYMWAYQHVGSGLGQKLLPFGMTIGVFIVRKVILALTDDFPLDTAMLISGFWVENIYDMFQTMAYRNVKLPVNYVSVWFTNCLSLLANLVFLTDTWFMFRIWIKAWLPRAFKGQCCPCKLGVEPDFEEIDDERGHSNNKIGYHRRQARFFMYKAFSKCIAACFYFLISTVLRFGVNRKLFPFASDSKEDYVNSLIFCVCNLIFLCCAVVGAALFVRYRHRKLYDHFVAERHTLKNRHMLGAVVALLINNGIVAISMIMYFNQIYYVVRKE